MTDQTFLYLGAAMGWLGFCTFASMVIGWYAASFQLKISKRRAAKRAATETKEEAEL